MTETKAYQLLQASPDPVLSTREVADKLGVSRRTALRYLKSLEDEGRVTSKLVGGRASVWWITDQS